MGKTPAKTIRFTLELSEDANERLAALAEQIEGTKSDVLRRAIALIEVAVEAKKLGRNFGIAKEGQELETRVIGL